MGKHHTPPWARKRTSSTSSASPPSSGSRRLLASWTSTRMASWRRMISSRHSPMLESLSAQEKHRRCLMRPLPPVNFTKMVLLFADKMAGGSDDDDVILKSFEAFEMDGKIDA